MLFTDKVLHARPGEPKFQYYVLPDPREQYQGAPNLLVSPQISQPPAPMGHADPKQSPGGRTLADGSWAVSHSTTRDLQLARMGRDY